jgi:hypothetical protein
MKHLVELLAAAVGHHPHAPQRQFLDVDRVHARDGRRPRSRPHHKPPLNFGMPYPEESRRTAASRSRERRPSLR